MKKARINRIIKNIFLVIYFLATGAIPVVVFGFVYLAKTVFFYSMAIAFISFIGMDILCSIIEDSFTKVSEKFSRAKRIRKKKKEEEVQRLENLLIKAKDYTEEIQSAKKSNKELQEIIKKNIHYLPKKVFDKVLEICNKMDEIIKILKQDPEEYYPIRHTFTVYFPKFKEMLYKLIDLSKAGSIEKSNVDSFMVMIEEVDRYLDFTKTQINKSDKLSLDVELKALTQSLQTERKRSEK